MRRLTRRSNDRVVAGVAGGLADYFGIDPIVFRIAFIALTIAGGSGLLIYLIGWLAIPEVGETTTFAETIIARIKRTRWLGLTLIVIAVAILLGEVAGSGSPLLWAIGLVAVGAMLLRDEPRRSRDVTHPVSTTVYPSAPAATVTEKMPKVRYRSPLGLYTLGAMFVIVAAAIASARLLVDLDIGQYFALALTVVGAGLVVGAWWGRSRLLILVGFLLIPLVAAASLVQIPLKGTIGSRYIEAKRGFVGQRLDILAGSLTMDLSRVDFSDTPNEIDANVVFGSTTIYVPPGVHVRVDGALDAGRANLFGNVRDGTALDLSGVYSRPGSTEGELVINVREGMGNVDLKWATWREHEIRAERRLERRDKAPSKEPPKKSHPKGRGNKR